MSRLIETIAIGSLKSIRVRQTTSGKWRIIARDTKDMAQQVLEAIYENGVFRILEPLKIPLEQGQLVRIISIENLDKEDPNTKKRRSSTKRREADHE